MVCSVAIVCAATVVVATSSNTSKGGDNRALTDALDDTQYRRTRSWARLRAAARRILSGTSRQESVRITYSFIRTGTPTGTGNGDAPRTLAIRDWTDASISMDDFMNEIEFSFKLWRDAIADCVPGLDVDFDDLGTEPSDIGPAHPIVSKYPRTDAIGDIRVGMYAMDEASNASTLAYAYMPSYDAAFDGHTGGYINDQRGDVLLNARVNWRRDADLVAVGAPGYSVAAVFAHEVGHALGLGHASDPSSIMYPSVSSRYVIAQRLPNGIRGSATDMAMLREILSGT